MHGQPGQGFELGAAPGHAARHETVFGGEHGVGVFLGAKAPLHRFGFQAGAAAGFAGRVAAVLGEQHADVHLVRLRLQVVEEAAHAVPLLVPAAAFEGRVTIDDPVALRFGHLCPRRAARDVGCSGVAHQVVLALLPGGGLHRLDGAIAQRLALVRNHQPQIDADHAAETTAGIARAISGIEREEGGLRVCVAEVAFGAVQAGGKAPDRGLRTLIGRQDVHADASAAALERRLDGLQRAGTLGALQAEAVGHHIKQLALARGGLHHALGLHARIAADRQPLRDFFGARIGGQLDGKGHHQAWIAFARAREQLVVDRFRRVVAHRQGGVAVEQLGGARKQQLQVIVQFRHRADRRA